MNTMEFSKLAGVPHYNVFYLKRLNKEKYDFIFSRHENKLKSFHQYCDYIDRLFLKMESILFRYEDNKSDYGRILNQLELNKTRNMCIAHRCDSRLVFKIRRESSDYLSIIFKKIKRFETIVNYFESVKDD